MQGFSVTLISVKNFEIYVDLRLLYRLNRCHLVYETGSLYPRRYNTFCNRFVFFAMDERQNCGQMVWDCTQAHKDTRFQFSNKKKFYIRYKYSERTIYPHNSFNSNHIHINITSVRLSQHPKIFENCMVDRESAVC